MSLGKRHIADQACLVALALVGLYHVSLLGQGALAWGDEGLYPRYSHAAARAVLHGEWAEAAAALAGWGARPGEYLLRVPAALVQLLVEDKMGIPVLNPDSLRIATAQNAVISFGLALAFWRLSLLLVPNRWVASVVSIAFCLLASNHIWVRHLLPYDAALMVHLGALHLCLLGCRIDPINPIRWTRSAIVGGFLGILLIAYPLVFYAYRSSGFLLALLLLLACTCFVTSLWSDSQVPEARLIAAGGLASGLALSIYPAYYAFTAACGLIVATSGRGQQLLAVTWGTIHRALLFGASVMLVMLSFETVSRIGGLSYLGGARLLAGTITQGSFEEGFVFLPKYLMAVDGPGGIAVVLLASLGALAIARGTAPVSRLLVRVVLVFAALYIAYGFQSAVLERMVFTGRYSRMYIPALLWLAGTGLASLSPRLRTAGTGAWLAISLAGFSTFAQGYRELAYPTDVLYRLGIGYEDLAPGNIRVEFEALENYNLPVKAVTVGADYITRPNDTRFVIVNFALPAYLKPQAETVSPPPGHSLLFAARHFISSPTFAWEGPPVQMREGLYNPGFRLSVYRRLTPEEHTLSSGGL